MPTSICEGGLVLELHSLLITLRTATTMIALPVGFISRVELIHFSTKIHLNIRPKQMSALRD